MKKLFRQNGFSAVELLLILLLVGLIVGAGVWVYKKKSNSPAKTKTELTSAEVGTTEGIARLTNSDLEEELAAEAELDSAEENAALSEANEVSGVGDGYDLAY